MASSSPAKHRIILDTDPGVDDSMAIFLALASKNIQIEGITITHGNSGDVNLLASNARRVLKMVGREDIPVYLGAADPLLRPYHGHGSSVWHGEDALGDVNKKSYEHHTSIEADKDFTSNTLTVPQNHESSAAVFIVKHCINNPGQISIVTIGPQTNIGIALKLEPNLPKYVNKFYMMGGCFNARGNVTPVAEANIHNDPESSKLIFKAGWKDLVIAPLDCTCTIQMNNEYLKSLSYHKIGRFIYDITRIYMKAHIDFYNMERMFVHDATIIMYLIDPTIFTKIQNVYVDVETKGELTVGQTIADWDNQYGKKPQANILMEADVPKFLETYRSLIHDAFSGIK